MHLNPLESGVEPHQLQHLHTHPESVVIPWVFRTLRMFLRSSPDLLLLVGLRCGKWLHKIWSHRLGESGVSAETLLALTLCCGSQAVLPVSSPRTLREGAVAHKCRESTITLCSPCVLLRCARTASLLLTGGTTAEFPLTDC